MFRAPRSPPWRRFRLHLWLVLLAAVLPSPSVEAAALTEAQALLHFKSQVNPSGALADWTPGSSPCHWAGVSCDGAGRVQALALNSSGLVGALADLTWLEALPSLESLDLSGNEFTGNLTTMTGCPAGLWALDLSDNRIGGGLPGGIGRLCPALVVLRLAGNRIDGSLPATLLMNCTTAVGCATGPPVGALDLSRNNISGPIPDNFFASCGSLTAVDMSSNLLSGPLPSSLKACARLTTLNLTANRLGAAVPLPADLPPSLATLHAAHNLFAGPLSSALFAALCPTLQSLDLSGNNLTGTLPDELALCGQLQLLAAGNNDLSGPFPTAALSPLQSLEVLHLPFNSFTGPFPAALVANCTALRVLDLSANALSGAISSIPCSPSSPLQQLLLPNNLLTGPIPPTLTNCSSLSIINLSFNRLYGPIPAVLGSLGSLERVSLWSNQLSGPIPEELGNLPHLRNLNLNNNLLSGEIPWQLSQCTDLEWINLNSNLLTGKIPSQLGLLQKLTLLELGNNSLSGDIPEELGNCSSLLWVDLNTNQLTGPIPRALGRHSPNPIANPVLVGDQLAYLRNSLPACKGFGMGIMLDFTGLTEASLATSPFTGCSTHPTVYVGGSLYDNPENRTLQYLDLSYNQLTGRIPEEMGTWVSLIILALSHNQLAGSIPATFGQLHTLGVMDLSYNQLEGSLSVLSSCSLLVAVDVSNNYFSGTIPSGQLSTNPAQSFANNSGLCGPPLPTACSPEALSPSSLQTCDGVSCSTKSRLPFLSMANSIVLGVLVACLCVGAFVVWLGFVMKNRNRRKENALLSSLQQSSCNGSSSWNLSGEREPLSINVATFERPLRKLTFSQLIEATNGFSRESLIGTGGFGEVYKAELKDGTVVAIKKLLQFSFQGDREFMAEMETLGKIKHRNLVPLLGYCKVGEERLLVYEFMHGGSLDEVLHGSSDGRERLNWDLRKQIAKGAARGLAFLHHNCIPHIIHRDMKSSNVLLDKDLEARVSDFGMARLISALDTHLSVSTLAGTPGYVPPEYYQSFRCTTKGDVYSFGVILLELVTGQRPTDKEEFGDNNLVGWVKLHVASNNSLEVLDPVLRGTGAEYEMIQYLNIACQCLDDLPSQRPTMLRVVAMLKELAFEDQSSAYQHSS